MSMIECEKMSFSEIGRAFDQGYTWWKERQIAAAKHR